MAKILRSLVRAQLLRSTRGVNGGSRSPRTVGDLAARHPRGDRGPLALTDCTPNAEECEHSGNCPANAVWSRVQASIRDILASASLEDLVSTPRRNNRVVFAEGPTSSDVTLS